MTKDVGTYRRSEDEKLLIEAAAIVTRMFAWKAAVTL